MTIAIILVLCLGPFLNEAIQTDDALFVWAGQWIQHHPWDFFGSKVNWWVSEIPMATANCNPPLMSYYLAGVASLFGWSEVALHLACMLVAIVGGLGIYALAQRWCDRPLLATIIAVLTPAYLVSSSTLMCDVPMLSLWIWTLVFWERALAEKASRWRYLGIGVLAGLTVLTKYSALTTLLPMMLLLGVLRVRRAGWWCLGLLVPVIIVWFYDTVTARMYGEGLLSAAIIYANGSSVVGHGGWIARGVIGLVFTGGSLLPLLFFAPWLWRPKGLLAGGIILLVIWFGLFLFWDDLGLIQNQNPETMRSWYYLLQINLCLGGGLLLLFLAATEIRRTRDVESMALAGWIGCVLFFTVVLNWTVNARSLLPIAPAAAILLARRLSATQGSLAKRRCWWALIPTVIISVSLVQADSQMADTTRAMTKQIYAKYAPPGHQLWADGGHGTFQYYMNKFGSRSIDLERSTLAPGDMVVLPIGYNNGFISLPPGKVQLVDSLWSRPGGWLFLTGSTDMGAAGFYASVNGPIPFGIGAGKPQNYLILRVDSKIFYNTIATNKPQLHNLEVPKYNKVSFVTGEDTVWQRNIEASLEPSRTSDQLAQAGKLKEAVEHYHQALKAQPDNPVLLNNLAWLLASTDDLAVRNGAEAVRLASRAVDLTDDTQPMLIGTLAAAYAADGQFNKAVETARTAHNLAMITEQYDIADRNAAWMVWYASGKAVDGNMVPVLAQ